MPVRRRASSSAAAPRRSGRKRFARQSNDYVSSPPPTPKSLYMTIKVNSEKLRAIVAKKDDANVMLSRSPIQPNPSIASNGTRGEEFEQVRSGPMDIDDPMEIDDPVAAQAAGQPHEENSNEALIKKVEELTKINTGLLAMQCRFEDQKHDQIEAAVRQKEAEAQAKEAQLLKQLAEAEVREQKLKDEKQELERVIARQRELIKHMEDKKQVLEEAFEKFLSDDI